MPRSLNKESDKAVDKLSSADIPCAPIQLERENPYERKKYKILQVVENSFKNKIIILIKFQITFRIKHILSKIETIND